MLSNDLPKLNFNPQPKPKMPAQNARKPIDFTLDSQYTMLSFFFIE